jgi:hypothetical protein
MQNWFLAVNDVCEMTLLSIVLHLLFLTTVSVIWWKRVKVLRVFFWPALILKLVAGIFLGLLYTYYYSVGDTFGFFQDATLLAKLARTDFLTYLKFLWQGDETFPVWADLVLVQPRSLFFVKFISFFSLITFDNYWLISLYISFMSFVATWFLVTNIVKLFPEVSFAAVISLLFLPSVVFWGSGIIKECAALACLCFLSSVFIKQWKNVRVPLIQWLLAAWAFWILWNLKYYYAAVYVPVVVTAYVIHAFVGPKLKLERARSEILAWAIIFVVPLFVVSLTHPNFYPERFLDVIVVNYQAFGTISDPNDMIHFYDLKATPSSMLINAPWALISGLFRPFIWESGNMLQFFIALENTVLVVFLVASFPAMRAIRTSPDRLLILGLIIYCVLLCVFVTLSTPNFGTLARYRVGYLPFFAFLVMCDNPLVKRIERVVTNVVGPINARGGGN